MIRYFMTDNQILHEANRLEGGVWVQMTDPSDNECEEISRELNVDIDDVRAALDEEESSRIELQDGYTTILVDIPTPEIRHKKQMYTTIPLGIIDTGCHCDDLHRGYAGSEEFSGQSRKRVQHKEAAALRLSDFVPRCGDLSDQSADYR